MILQVVFPKKFRNIPRFFKKIRPLGYPNGKKSNISLSGSFLREVIARRPQADVAIPFKFPDY